MVKSKAISMTVTVEDSRLELALENLSNRIKDFRRFWREFWAPQFFGDIQRNFRSQGGSVGGWRALSPKYAAWKRSVVGNKPILQFSGEMKASLMMGDRNNVFRSMKTRVIAGSRLPRVGYHNRGGGHLPRRQVIFIGPRKVYQPLLDRYVAEEMRAAGMPNVKGVA